MGGADAEPIRDAYEHWSRGDLNASIFHPDVEVVWADGMLDTSVDKGLDAFAQTMQQYMDVVTGLRIVAHEIHPGPDGILVLAELIGTGRESGAETQTPVTHLWELEDGKARRVTGWFGHRRDLIPDPR